ncbi:MAG: hypothetical protein H0V44_12850 [Planctomycetes bacterium]|nr:hypothetical protein [Planctomycetota bacterium]
MTIRTTAIALTLTVLASVVVYAGGYLMTGTCHTVAGYAGLVTTHSYPVWIPYRIWYPLAWLEARMRGNAICLTDRSDRLPVLVSPRR